MTIRKIITKGTKARNVILSALLLVFTTHHLICPSDYTQKDVDASFNYYRRLSDTQNLSPNDRLAILNRIVEKYSSVSGVDLSKVKLEIKKQQGLIASKKTQPSASVVEKESKPDKKTAKPQEVKSFPAPIPDSSKKVANRLWDAILDESDNEFILNLISDRPESKNSFVLKDPDPFVPPKIVLDLYGLTESIKDISKKDINFPQVSASVEKIKIAQFEKEPSPVVRIVVFLKKEIKHIIKDTDSGIAIILLKDPADKGKRVLASAKMTSNIPDTRSAPQPKKAPAPAAETDSPLTAPPSATLQKPEPPPQPAKAAYKIEPGDVLSVNIYPAEDLSRDVAVSPDGDITLPLIGVVRAAGNSTSRLAEVLARAYSKYISNPEVSVTIKQYARRTVFITGELKSTGGYPYKDGLRLLELISQAGGFSDRADRKRIKIIRGDGKSRKTFTVDVEEIVRSGDLAKDFILEAGDMVEVPEGQVRKISILGDVRMPGYYDYKDGLKLVEAMSMAGGFSDSARITKVSVLRRSASNGGSRSITVNMHEILKGAKPDFEIMPDDTIYVPKKTITTAHWWVSNVLPWLSFISLILVIRGGL